jgi:hypothetical protein
LPSSIFTKEKKDEDSQRTDENNDKKEIYKKYCSCSGKVDHAEL